MNIEMFNKGSHLLAQASGRLDTATAEGFREAITAGFENIRNVIIDLSKVESVSSAGLRSLLTLEKLSEEKSGFFAVCSLTKDVADTFKISGCDRRIRIFSTPEEAAESI